MAETPKCSEEAVQGLLGERLTQGTVEVTVGSSRTVDRDFDALLRRTVNDDFYHASGNERKFVLLP